MGDILFRKDGFVFSYRVAGIVVQNGLVLLQQAPPDPGYAFPGGHVALGETGAQALAREFREETGADAAVGNLRWVGEIFFPWDGKPCHQICLYYDVSLNNPAALPTQGGFDTLDHIEGRDIPVRFSWLPLDGLGDALLYPPQAAALLQNPPDEVAHFVYRE